MKKHKPKLKRELTLFTATIYGVGIILGAGIYALIGKGAAMAGNNLWISFVIAALLASLTGLSYAELSSIMPKEGAEFTFVSRAFRIKSLSFMIGWISIIGMLVGASTVALGFAGYFSAIIPIPVLAIAVALIILISFVNYWGIKKTSQLNVIATFIELSGLVLIIVLGLNYMGNFIQNIDVSSIAVNTYPIIGAAALMFFAFIGFEEIVNVSEETKKAGKIIPKALILSIIITSVIYVLVSISAVSIVNPSELAESSAPMASVVSTALGSDYAIFMVLIALVSTFNTVLLLLVSGSRFIFSLGRASVLPKKLSVIHSKYHTPHFAIIASAAITILALAIGNIKQIAEVTTLNIFILFLFVNLSAIKARYKFPSMKRMFAMPLNIGKFPLISFFGAVVSVLMFFYFSPDVWLVEIIILLLGFVLYAVLER